MALLKAALYILAVLFLVGGGLCAASGVFMEFPGMDGIVVGAVMVMAFSVVVMLAVGRPRFSAGSAGETVLFILLFTLFVLPALQGPLYMLGLGEAAPLVSLAAFAALVYYLVRRYRSHVARRAEAQPPSTDPPPQA